MVGIWWGGRPPGAEAGWGRRLQLGHLQQVDAVLGGEEGDDERHTQVRHGEEGEEQL